MVTAVPHGDGHAHAELSAEEGALDRRLLVSVVLNAIIVVAEIAGGLLSGSLALLSDAMHNLSDVAALAIAWGARRIGRAPPSPRHTFGLRRVEVLAALLNSATLLVVITLIVHEAIARLRAPEVIDGPLMLTVAVIGLLGNLFSVFILRAHAHGDDLNTRSAFLHLIQDTLSSVVVVGAALLAGWTYGPLLDPIASIVVALAVVRSGWQILREALGILMEATPPGVDLEALARECEKICEIEEIHHIHVWETGAGVRMLTAHVRLPRECPLSEVEARLAAIRAYLAERWKIFHATLEPELRGCGSTQLIEPEGHGPAPAPRPAPGPPLETPGDPKPAASAPSAGH